MVTKLSTSGNMSTTPVVNVKETKGQFFVGVLDGHRAVESQYKNEDGTSKKFNVYQFKIEDTDMKVELKVGAEYKEVAPNSGDLVAIFAPTRLHNALSRAEMGMRLKITYLGLGKATKFGGKPHDFDVEVI